MGEEFTLAYRAIRNSEGMDGQSHKPDTRRVVIRMGERIMFAEPPHGSYSRGKQYNGRIVYVPSEDFEPE